MMRLQRGTDSCEGAVRAAWVSTDLGMRLSSESQLRPVSQCETVLAQKGALH